MTTYFAFEAPLWFYILLCGGLAVIFTAFGWGLATATGLSRRFDQFELRTVDRADVQKWIAHVHTRLDGIEGKAPGFAASDEPPRAFEVPISLPWHEESPDAVRQALPSQE